MIIRAIHDRENPFFLMRRATAQDRNLSFEARGVLAYLFSKPSDWTLRIEDLRAQVAESARSIGRDKMNEILGELKTHGYLRRARKRQPSGAFDYDTEIYESPHTDPPYTADQYTADQYTADQYTADQLLVSRSHTCRKRTENRKQERERQKKEKQQQQAADSSTAAAAAQTEPHKSLHSLADVRRYVEATKRHATNPGGLARYLWENGKEDAEIGEWLETRERQARERETWQARSDTQSDFDWEDWIEQCVRSGWTEKLEAERAGIIERGGPREPWERRVCDYFNQQQA